MVAGYVWRGTRHGDFEFVGNNRIYKSPWTQIPEFLQGVCVTSLDEFTCTAGILFPNHIKIDVDGTESDIIAGMESVMRDERLKTIMIEINADISQGEIERAIVECGLEEMMAEQWSGKNTFNRLFVRK